jgi:3-deoxy-7-phosphoheptulonate synthase
MTPATSSCAAAATGPNYQQEEIKRVEGLLTGRGLPTQLMVDCSHGNSEKDYHNQPGVAEELCRQIAGGSRSIAAVMVESNLIEGAQKLSADPNDLVYGQSVTDSCIGWADTVSVLEKFAEAVRRRRAIS